MKHIVLSLAALAALVPAVAGGATVTRDEGLQLAKKSGCLACHAIDHKVIGPAWMDVSKRYRGNAGARQQLITKVTNGGKGNWTSVTGGVPMPPYGPRASHQDIEKLVDFILSLAK